MLRRRMLRWSHVSNLLSDAPTDNPRALLVYVVLLIHTDVNGECELGIERISQLAHVSRKSVTRLLVRLEELGVLKVDRRPGRPSRYMLRVDTLESPDLVDTPESPDLYPQVDTQSSTQSVPTVGTSWVLAKDRTTRRTSTRARTRVREAVPTATPAASAKAPASLPDEETTEHTTDDVPPVDFAAALAAIRAIKTEHLP